MSAPPSDVAQPPDPSGSETVELSVPFGQMLVVHELASKEEVEQMVELQTQLSRRGIFVRLGELVVARGLVDEATVARLLSLQGTTILICGQCYAQFNVLGYQPNKNYRCARCSEYLKRPEHLDELSVEDTLVHEAWAAAFDLDKTYEGEREFGDYLILGQISRGGMGIIYKARQRSLDRVVAMKVMAGADTTSEAQARFNSEARAVASLRHPHIVAIHEVGREGDIDYFTMEYVEGLQLQRAVASEGLTPREIAEIFLKLCDAVDYAHGQGILHRDLKPQNILLDRKQQPTLIDFGIFDRVGPQRTGGSREIVGSPAYLPPEYIAGSAAYDQRGEVYGLGATLYAVLAGRPPHTGMDTVAVLKRAHVEPVVPIRSIKRSLDRTLAEIVMTALARDPRQRYPAVRALGDDLRRWLQGEEIAGNRAPWQRTWARIRARVAAAVGLAVAIVLVLMTSVATWERAELEERERSQRRQSDREQQALRLQIVDARLEVARMHLEAERPQLAEEELTRLLRHEAGQVAIGRIHALRAQVRLALGDEEGALADQKMAKTLGE